MKYISFNFQTFLTALGGLVVFVLFLASLMTAVSQQKISSLLKDSEHQLTYTEAFNLYNQSKNLNSEIQKANKNLSSTSKQAKVLEMKIESELDSREEFRERMQRAIGDAKLTEWCPKRFEVRGEALTGRIVMDKINECISDGESKDDLVNYEEIVTSYGGMRGATDRLKSARENQAAIDQVVDQEGNATVQLRELQSRAAAVAPYFVAEQRTTEIVSWSKLHLIPPTVMPIILTLISGAFGAVLIHLILLCYPDNEYSIKQSRHMFQYVGLGALIATAIFVVLVAGNSVIGFSGQGMGEPDKYLTFSSIGLFSGMFSNRAADWLSDKASFLSTNRAT
ncbi:hypothetical protein [Parasphingorhabdus sp.]|uniref:hypothetical protein n=1 Tax=Parasphingorhabdus sp. TaxID=2709688 RepID=UPI0032632800